MARGDFVPTQLALCFAEDLALAKEFHQVVWDEQLEADCREILKLAAREDLGEAGDWTTRALIPEEALGSAAVVVRCAGVIAGLPAAEMILEYFDARLEWLPKVEDGRQVRPGECIARIHGPAASLLTVERLLLNMLGRLSGVATLTRRYVDAVKGTKARVYDTRKTTPGWRRLEKYAVRCGGGHNHRTGLFQAVLIKDNHLAADAPLLPTARSCASQAALYTPAEAVRRVRQYIEVHVPQPLRKELIVELEVDTLEQLEQVLPVGPDIVLLDNMSPAELRRAVLRRDECNPAVELEASGGVDLDRIGEIAASGVDRISVGALTHSAVCLDLGLDWLRGETAEC